MINEDSPVMLKTRELCQTILDQPAMKTARQRIDAFLDDEPTRQQYQSLVNKGQELQQKQQNAVALSNEEIAQFEQERDALLENAVAKGFLDAQEEIHEMQHTIHKFVSKSLDLGRLPNADDLQGGHGGHGCDGQGGCGCGH